jgi:hypothetical protein
MAEPRMSVATARMLAAPAFLKLFLIEQCEYKGKPPDELAT